MNESRAQVRREAAAATHDKLVVFDRGLDVLFANAGQRE